MTKIYYILIFFLPALLIAQDNRNYVKTTTYKTETSTPINPPTAKQAMQTITYFDGLGRPIQQRDHKQSTSGKDIVTYIEYDQMGRQTKEFLPYISQAASLEYDPAAYSEVLSFYSSPSASRTGNPNFEGTLNPYTERLYEKNSLGRVVKKSSPGNSWQMGSGHEIRTDFLANTSSDAVKIYKALAGTYSNGSYMTTLSSQGYYQAGELYNTITKDENWTSGSNNSIQEFKNKKGQLLLKRKYGSSLVNGVSTETWHDTYFVYDQSGNLCFVLPPLSDGSGSSQDLAGQCYQYKYDIRNRLVEKKIPGKDWEYLIYDRLDRVVAKGPTLSPFTNIEEPNNLGWQIIKYDYFDRPVYTGWMQAPVTSNDRNIIQNMLNELTSSISEAKIASATNTTVNGVAFRYSNVSWPTSGYHVLSVNYYDDYNFPNAPTSFADIEGQSVFYNMDHKPKGLATGKWTRILETSLLTKAETSHVLYDKMARPIRNWSSNYLGGYTQVDSKLDFSGNSMYKITTHKRTASSAILSVREDFTYNDQEKLVSHTHTINTNPTELIAKNEYDELGRNIAKDVGNIDGSPLQKIDYSYNILGWLKEINKTDNLVQANAPADLFAFKINYNLPTTGHAMFNGNISETYWRTLGDNRLRKYSYSYDAMDRLTNAVYDRPGSVATPNSYGESIAYDKNGNIKKLERYGNLDDAITAFKIDELTYDYDTSSKNKLIKVSDATLNPNGFSDGTNTEDDYSFDLLGNLKKDLNKGITNIVYNHLNLPVKIVFGSESKSITYLYNAAGKKISKSIPYENGSAIGGYSFATFDYLGGFNYQGSTLKFFPTQEGYVQKTGNFYSYVYNYTDHLGNVRLSYAKDPENPNVLKIIEENHYYPFGFKHANYNSDLLAFKEKDSGLTLKAAPVNPGPQFNYNYKYNGKEFQDELDLDLYDYGARNYDPAIARWTTPDPLLNDLDFTFNPNDVDQDNDEDVAFALQVSVGNGEGIFNTNNLNPFGYGYNNPVSFDDPDGRCPLCAVLLLLLAAEPASAPTLDTAGDAKKVAAARNDKAKVMLFAVPATRLTTVESTAVNIGKNKLIDKVTDKSKEIKKVPNPNGKKGGAAHQKTVEREEAKMKDAGFKTKREVMVNTPNGEKTKRFIDVEGKHSKTGEIKQVQVGRQNKNGTPVAREKRALDDIEAETGTRPTFVPYN